MEKWPTKATVSLNSAFLIYKVGANRYQVPMTVCQALDVLALSSPPPAPQAPQEAGSSCIMLCS